MAVLISIKPKYCELIANGKKTIEVRKTRPKCETPFKCYIYQSKPDMRLFEVLKDGDDNYGEVYHGKTAFLKTYKDISAGSLVFGEWQKVIGEFTCNTIVTVDCDSFAPFSKETGDYIDKLCCLNRHDLWEYTHGRCAYGWHISDLKIYDKAKELNEFKKPCTPECNYSEECGGTNALDCLFSVTRAPQSWMYVEELI